MVVMGGGGDDDDGGGGGGGGSSSSSSSSKGKHLFWCLLVKHAVHLGDRQKFRSVICRMSALLSTIRPAVRRNRIQPVHSQTIRTSML